ncbi:hypothetical protein [Streptomyces sp. LUP30]|uniref:hypothetical protein n=1 Tax=Streptomyces sp. LUP30 TaxID=1890285 RepID=UPI0008516FD4|nr:hypothetical protein [Streptomyces sp. LUP30]
MGLQNAYVESAAQAVSLLDAPEVAASWDLLTRMVELAVPMDDLAVSVGLSAPRLPRAAFDPVVALLTELAARRHGRAALLRALTRAERGPSAINVF